MFAQGCLSDFWVCAAGSNSLLQRNAFNFFLFTHFFLFTLPLVFVWKQLVCWLFGQLGPCHSLLPLFMSRKMRCSNHFAFAGWKSLCCETGMVPQESVLMSEECDKMKTVSTLLSFLIFGIALLIIQCDMKEGTARANHKPCSTSLIILHRTYLVIFCSSQTITGICAKQTFIILNVIMPVPGSSARSTAKMGLEYDLGILEVLSFFN